MLHTTDMKKIVLVCIILILLLISAVIIFNNKKYVVPSEPTLPVYPGAVRSAYEDEEMEGEITYQYLLIWETKDNVPDVMHWYMNLPDKDWKVKVFPTDPGAIGAQDALITYQKSRIYLLVNKGDIDQPTYIFAGINPE